jgi:exosortase
MPIAGVIAWTKREKLAKMPLSSHIGGLWMMVFALCLHLSELILDMNGPSPSSIPFFVAGAVWYFAGTEWLKELSFPIAYLFFMVPIPGPFNQFVSAPLRVLASNGSRAIVAHFGIDVLGAGNNMEFRQPNGYDYVRLIVADPCSGLHSLMAIKALHAITAYLSRLKLGWKWVLFMCALPISLAANVCRLVLIILVAGYIDKDFGLKAFHDYSPYVLFACVFAILISVGRFMEWATGAHKKEKTDGNPSGGTPAAPQTGEVTA